MNLNMDLNNFTTIARSALTEAQNYALAHSNPSLTDLHLLSSLLKTTQFLFQNKQIVQVLIN